MGFLKNLGLLVALMAVCIGIVGKAAPHLFLNIPNIGFVFFMLVGGNNGILPPYFDITPFQGDNPKEWLRDGDVVVATGAKAGTTWMCYCIDSIRRKGSDEMGLPYTDIMLTTPWMELPHQPGETWDDRSNKYNTTTLPDGTKLKDYWDNAAFPFRTFKSHFMPRGDAKQAVLPVKEMPNVKFVMSARNPLEVAKSIHSFFPKHKASFRNMWGGFPPLYANAEAAMKALLPGGELYDLYFGYVKAWWPYMKEPNVLPLHYTDMVKDVPALVDKLAMFVGVALNTEEKAKVVEKCGFKHMKANSNLFDYRLPLNTRGMGESTIMESGTFVNKGKSGNAEEGISEEAVREFTRAIDTELTDPELKKWAVAGGEI